MRPVLVIVPLGEGAALGVVPLVGALVAAALLAVGAARVVVAVVAGLPEEVLQHEVAAALRALVSAVTLALLSALAVDVLDTAPMLSTGRPRVADVGRTRRLWAISRELRLKALLGRVLARAVRRVVVAASRRCAQARTDDAIYLNVRAG